MKARLLRYEQFRARGEEPPPTPDSMIEKEVVRLTVPAGEEAPVRPDSPSSQGRGDVGVNNETSVIFQQAAPAEMHPERGHGSPSGPAEPPTDRTRVLPSTPRYQFPHNETAWSARSQTSATNIYNIMRKWNLQFSGTRGGDAKAFLVRIEKGRLLAPVSDEDVFRCLPFFLSGTALHWYRARRNNWRSWGEFVLAWRARFGDPDFSFALRDEIMRRTQGEHEPVTDFITCMQALFDRLSPPWSLHEQLNYVYHNMLPRLQVSVHREDFYDFDSLECLATRVERSYNASRRYQAPPPPERSLFPELAYCLPRKGRKGENPTTAGLSESKRKTNKNQKSATTVSTETNKPSNTNKTPESD